MKTLNEERVRYDFSVAVTRIALNVEKKVVVDHEGERHVVSASTREFGPPRFSVTWSALATLAVLVGQFAIPFNRLGIMFSTAGKRFTAASLSRMLHYVAERFLPIYLRLATELANSQYLAGDDTPCRVIEVSSHFAKAENGPSAEKHAPPWAAYRTPRAAEENFGECEKLKLERLKRRADGDRGSKRTPDETPSLGVLIGRKLAFESRRRNGAGEKVSMNTTVVSGRSVPDDPTSLIVFYRSHLGSYGNLLEDLLRIRSPEARTLTVQGDLSTTNLVTSPDLLDRFLIHLIGCAAHARRPFANYEHEDRLLCSRMLHLFKGLAIHEDRLDAHGRNRKNVLAVRQNESRALWNDILELATTMANKWSPATKLGAGARYIINHFDKLTAGCDSRPVVLTSRHGTAWARGFKLDSGSLERKHHDPRVSGRTEPSAQRHINRTLTAYLDDPSLEPTNNLRERMLRMEKLIEGSSMFRRTLEGRFVLDVIRTILQTAAAAGVPVHKYLVSVLRTSEDELAEHPERFTPRAWAEVNADDIAPPTDAES